MHHWLLITASCAVAAGLLVAAPSATGGAPDEDVTTFSAPATSGTPDRVAVAKPQVLDIKRTVAGVEPNGVTLFTRVFNIDTSAGIDELWQRFRAEDKEIAARGKSAIAKEVEAAMATPALRRKYGLMRASSAHFDLVGPNHLQGLSKGRLITINLSNTVDSVLAAAERAYQNAASFFLMQPFFDWSVAPARIYLIGDPELWSVALAPRVQPNPIQTVYVEATNREFFVYINPATLLYAGEATAYAVTRVVGNEFARMITGKPSAALPLFFADGLAGAQSGLEAVLTREGPRQVAQFTVDNKTYNVRQVKRGFLTPLAEKKLIAFDDLTTATEYPTRAEDLYYFLRQSSMMIDSLSSNAPLATVSLARALANGAEFKKEIGLSYMEMQRDVLGRAVVDAAAKTEAARRGETPDFDRMAAYMRTLFQTMTQEHMTEQRKQARKAAAGAAAGKKP